MCNNTSFAGTRDAANHVIRQGKFAQWMGLGQQPREYDYVQGRLTGISLRKHELPGGEMTYMDIHFQNGETRFDVSALASGSVAADLISKLVNVRDLKSMVRIDVWAKDRYTNSSVYENGEKLPFRMLPKVDMAMIDKLNGRIAQAARAGNSSN